jgi:hypothetical protein
MRLQKPLKKRGKPRRPPLRKNVRLTKLPKPPRRRGRLRNLLQRN